MREAKIRKINRSLDAFLAKNQTVRTAHLRINPEPFSRSVSPFLELIQEVEDFTGQNLVSLTSFLRRSPGKAQECFDKCEDYISQLQKRELELNREFTDQVISNLLGKLKRLRKWVYLQI